MKKREVYRFSTYSIFLSNNLKGMQCKGFGLIKKKVRFLTPTRITNLIIQIEFHYLIDFRFTTNAFNAYVVHKILL
jgi:hypothetical protein